MPKPRKWRVARCTRKCTLHEYNLPGAAPQQVHAWFEEGLNDKEISTRLDAGFDHHVSFGAVARHRKNHLVPEDQLVRLDGTAPIESKPGRERPKDNTELPKRRVGDLELLDALIAKGAETAHMQHVKVTAEQMLRAIELKHKMTQGSVFADFFGAIGAVMEEEEPGAPENPDAAASADEQEQADGGE